MQYSSATSSGLVNVRGRVNWVPDDFPRLLQLLWRLTYITAGLGLLLTDGAVLRTSGVLAAFAALWLATELGAATLRNNKNIHLVFCVIGMYFAVGYPGKLVALVYLSEHSWIAGFSNIAASLEFGITRAFLLCTGGMLAVLAGLVCGQSRYVQGTTVVRASSSALYVTIVLLLSVRLTSQIFLDIGIPGRRPIELGIPFISGVIAFLGGPIVFALTNINLYLQFFRNRERRQIGLALGLVLANVLLDLWVGYKQALVLQSVVLVSYLLALTPRVDRRGANVLRAALLVGFLSVGIFYKYVNDYRFALLSGENVASAIETAALSPRPEETNTLLAIGNRINGVENFYASLAMNEGRTYSLNAVFGDELVRAFVGDVYGDDDVTVTFGLTQFSALYAAGGIPLLLIGGFCLGVVMRYTATFAFEKILRYDFLAAAYAPILALFYLRVLFAGGELVLYLKEMLLSLAVLYAIRRSLFRASISAQSNSTAGRLKPN